MLESPWFLGFALLCVPVQCAANIGLLFFKRWARTLSLWATVVGFGFESLAGASVFSGVAIAIQDLSSVLWGASLAVAFLSPLQEKFASVKNDV